MDDKPVLYIPPGISMEIIGQVFHTDRPRTQYEIEVGAALKAAILRVPSTHARDK